MRIINKKEYSRLQLGYGAKKILREEQRLCEGVIELAEQNVSVQREISSFNERDTESRNKMEQQLKELITRLKEMLSSYHEN